MPTLNLWGQLPPTEKIRTPTQILKEQATALDDMTKGALQGSVTVRHDSQGTFNIDLDIVAPALDNYTYNVLEASHGLNLYPVKVRPGWKKFEYKEHFECADEEQLDLALGQVLTSPEVKRVITTLLAQSRAM
jgi:hypothetical protein